MLDNKNILLISPEPWDHIFVSKHHYAVHLAKRGNVVFFLNPPEKKAGIKPTKFENVFEVDYKGFPKGLRFYPSILQRIITLRVFRRLMEMCSVHFDIVWSFDNSVFFDFSAIPIEVLKISHIVDFNQDFQTRKAASTADFCFCVTEGIKNLLTVYNTRVYKIGHGYYGPARPRLCQSVEKSGRLKAVYAGNLSIPYIDWVLLAQVVEHHPRIDFVFVGPNEQLLSKNVDQRDAKERALKRPNSHFPGRVDFTQLQEYYHSADVLLVAYQEAYHNTQVANTHKMMEYLGAGKVIVSTKTLEYLNFHPLIVMSEHNSEWLDLFNKVILQLDFYNSIELKTQRSDFALQHAYGEQIRKIDNILCVHE